MPNIPRAAVIGASISGLMAARALSDAADEIAVFERDELPKGPEHRKGVGQGKQIHLLLPGGLEVAEEFFPGLTDTLVADGAVLGDSGRDIAYLTAYGWQVRTQAGTPYIGLTRPLLEWRMRERVMELPNVRLVRAEVAGLSSNGDGSAVNGLLIKGQEEAFGANLVVDASGRTSNAPRWMEELGYLPPEEVHVNPWIGYASQLIKLAPDALPPGVAGLEAIGPQVKRGGMIWPAGNGLHWLAANGQMRDYPPRDREDLLAWLADGLTPLISEIASAAEPKSEIATYKKPGNQRRLWEALTARPAGFVVVGDAVASFNPIYAQGMTMAAYAARALREVVRDTEGDVRQIADLLPRAISGRTDVAFAMSAGGDATIKGAELTNFERPNPSDRQYDDAVSALSTEDPVVAAALLRALGYIDSTPLETVEVRSRVDRWLASSRRTKPADPRRLPQLVDSACEPEE